MSGDAGASNMMQAMDGRLQNGIASNNLNNSNIGKKAVHVKVSVPKIY